MKRKNILVVDNDKLILEFIRDLLSKEGHNVRTADDGLSALEHLGTFIPDIVLADLVMPNIDGSRLCRIIRYLPELKDVFVIILSGVAAEQDIPPDEIGADACIAKGPIATMSEHILATINDLQGKDPGGGCKEIRGLDDINFRTITKELLSSQKHFETILEGMSEGILELSSEGKIVYCNPVSESLLGRPEEKLLASTFFDLFKKEDRKRLETLFKNPGSVSKMSADESPLTLGGRQLAFRFLPVEDRDSNTTIVIIDDITLKKDMEARFLQVQKMEAVGTLAGGIAHDFNNLLMGMQGYLSLTMVDLDESHPHYRYLKGIQEQIKSGSELTRQLLDFARGRKFEVNSTDINELIKKTSQMFGRTKKEIEINFRLQKDIWNVEVDRGQMEQTLLNLMVNAWQAMDDGGRLTLETRNIRLDKAQVTPYKVEPGNYVEISVTDTGKGMDDKTKKNIFQPFFTTKKRGMGTGLGLSSVYSIIKNHCGFINVESELGKGATFNIYIPASCKKIMKSEDTSNEIHRGSGTVLLVDDEEVIIDVGFGILQKLGYRVIPARSGKEAIEVLNNTSSTAREPDLVILDMVMPEMDGAQTYDRLKRINPDVKVLFSSGYNIDDHACEFLKQNCDGFIQKPFNISELSQSIKQVLN